MPELIPPFQPRRTYGFLSIAVLAVVAVIAVGAAWAALAAVERVSQSAVERALFLSGEDWAEVEVNGLQVILSGEAPSEAARFAALSAAGHEVDGARVIDQMALPEAVAIEPPRFSVEMLRNEAGISLIGLIPAETDREALTSRIRTIDPIDPVADFLETADHPTPEGWDSAFDFMLYVAAMLPRSKISMDADHVAVEAIAASPDQKREWEQEIRRERPAGLRLALDIRAPLDVISPYIVRFLADNQGARFDACTAYTPAGRNKIVSAGIAAGAKGRVDCTIGLGVPSPDWPDAVARGIRAVRDMGGGSLTFSDADITLIAPADTPQETYDRVMGELEADLPEVFSLHGVLTEPEAGTASPAGPPEFIATLADGGSVQLRGRVASEQDRTIVETLARARFGTRKVYAPLRLDPALPASWAVRTLAGLEALDQLADGRVVVRPDVVTVTGTTGDKGASAMISRLLSEKLGDAEDFRVNVKYEEALDPVAAMPTPQECVADVNAVLAKRKIGFAPGSAEIERASADTVDRIAEILKTCPDVAMEIGGYTDSQGREEMNQALSQRRADSVVRALLARRVLTTNLTAFGYGEDYPIADNGTEEGREANRRIEFSLVGEARARSEPEDGDAPTIRPPARPTPGAADDGSGGDGEEADVAGADAGGTGANNDVDAAAPEDGAPPAMTSDSDADAAAGDEDGAEDSVEIPEVTGAGAPETTPEAVPELAQETGGAAADAAPAAIAAGPEGTEVDVEGETVAGENMAASVSQAADPAVAADIAVETEGAETSSAPDRPTLNADAEVPTDGDAEAPAAIVPEAETDPAKPVAESAADPAATDAPAEDTDGADPTIPETAQPTETPAPDLATDPDQTGAAEGSTSGPTPQAADPASSEADAADTANATEAAEDAAAIVSGEADAGAEDATDLVPATDAAETTDDTAAAEQTGPTETETSAEAAETAADPDAGSAAPVAAPDMPSIRPRPRPPLVVHPDLEGIRPRPRPAIIPDAPSTE